MATFVIGFYLETWIRQYFSKNSVILAMLNVYSGDAIDSIYIPLQMWSTFWCLWDVVELISLEYFRGNYSLMLQSGYLRSDVIRVCPWDVDSTIITSTTNTSITLYWPLVVIFISICKMMKKISYFPSGEIYLKNLLTKIIIN